MGPMRKLMNAVKGARLRRPKTPVCALCGQADGLVPCGSPVGFREYEPSHVK